MATLQVGKLRHREAEQSALGPTAGEESSWVSDA